MNDLIKTPCGCPETIGGKIGQTVYVGDGRVVNEAGQGIQAGFFYVDKNGTKVSQEFTTDANGYFHWDIDNTNVADTFINFYSTADYEPVVLTPDELFNKSLVVLKSTQPGKTNYILPLVAGGILLVAATHKGRGGSMGALDIKKHFQGMDPTVKKVLIYGGGALAAWYIFNWIAKKPTPDQQKEIDAAKQCLATLAAEKGILPTLSDLEIASMIANLKDAIGGCGTDEEQVYGQFRKMQNDADLCKLIAVHGVQRYKACFEEKSLWDLLTDHVSYTVSQALYADLNASEIGNVNGILSNNGLTYQF